MALLQSASVRLLVINSTVCYVLAFLVTTMLHECGHYFVGFWLGSEPVLHHNYVAHAQRDALPVMYKVWIALAGPLVSLAQGLFLLPFVRSAPRRGMYGLFLLWSMLLGFGNFLGYLITGPLFTAGDIGKVHELLQVPMGLRVGIALLGAAALAFIAYSVTRPFLLFATEPSELSDPGSRTLFNARIIILPWLIGAGVITLLYLPVVAMVSIIYPLTSGMVFIFPWKNAKRIVDAQGCGTKALMRPAWVWYALLLGTILFFRLVLAPGIDIVQRWAEL